MKHTISVVISAFNEERHIEALLKSVEWADEIVVIDNESTDATSSIAKKYKARVFKKPNLVMLNKNKNFGFLEAKSDWILNLDGDESVSGELSKEIQNVIEQDTDITGYWIPRKNSIFGKWIKHGLWWPDKQLRLFRKGKGEFPCIHVHEYLQVNGQTSELQEPLDHKNYESIAQFYNKLNTIYTENEVSVLENNGAVFHWFDLLRKPFADFVNIYFSKEGYKDGTHGLVLSILQAIYAFTIEAKRWEKQGFTDQSIPLSSTYKELSKGGSDIAYWYYTERLKEEKNPFKRLLYRILRKYATIR